MFDSLITSRSKYVEWQLDYSLHVANMQCDASFSLGEYCNQLVKIGCTKMRTSSLIS